jgi:parvulin-like peptidyl-prolyl isomerase
VQYGFTQSNLQPPAGADITPETVIATVNGKKFTAGEYQQLLRNMNPQMRESAMKQPRALLEQFAMFQNILAEAEQSKLEEQSPYREQIAEARRQVLVQARINEKTTSVVVSPDEVRKHYEENHPRYTEARAKVIFISQVLNEQSLDGKQTKKREPEESKALAQEVLAKVQAGGDFAALAKQYSDDGTTSDTGADLPDAIRSTSSTFPADIREAILKASKGDILGPLEHQTGFYIFRIESIDLTPFDKVKGDIYNELKQAGLTEWLEATKNRSTVTIENDLFFAKPVEPAQK